MPIYEYECKKCDTVTERLEKMHFNDSNCPVCPCCGGKTKRKFSKIGAVIYNSKGFYSTDSTKKPSQPPKKDAPDVPGATREVKGSMVNLSEGVRPRAKDVTVE